MNPLPLSLRARIERWPIAGNFTISRGSKTEAVVVTVEITDGQHTGRGECVPYLRYGETPEKTLAAIEAMKNSLAQGLDRRVLQGALPSGAARNALDCAFWDLESKREGCPVHELAGLPAPKPLVTAYTISIDTPEAMGEATRKAGKRPLLKIKLGADGDAQRLEAVRSAAPDAELIVDANEGWTTENLAANFAACEKAGVTMIEQPLPAGNDAVLARIPRPIPVCADESVHDRASLAGLRGKYDAVNIKLDKCGGLTEAIGLAKEAQGMGFSLMIGCMVSTSLAIAPALLLAQQAHIVDLDGPLLLAKDRPCGVRYDGGLVYPPEPALWG